MQSAFYLAEGLVIAYEGLVYEMRSRAGALLQFEHPQTGTLMQMSESDFWKEHCAGALRVVEAFSSPAQLILPKDQDLKTETFPATLRLEDFPERWQQDLQRKLGYVRAVAKQGVKRGQLNLLRVVAKQHATHIGDRRPPGTSTLWKWMKNYQESNADPASLLCRHPRRQRSRRLKESEEAFMSEIIETVYLTKLRCSIQYAYDRYKSHPDRPKADANEVASYRTFALRIRAHSHFEMDVARRGRQEARQRYRMAKRALPADGPLDFVEIDHTLLNLYVIDDITYCPLGRPTLTVIRDRYSRVILGFYLSFDGPGLSNVQGALRHSLRAHTAVHNMWPDLENPWPAFGLGATYVCDRGVEFLSPRFQLAITGLGAEYLYCGRHTPWHKASIERFFETLETSLLETTRGKTFRSLKERGDYDPRRDAVVRFSTLVYLLHKWAVDAHNATPNRSIGSTPLERWIEGIQYSPPPYAVSDDRLGLQFGKLHIGRLRHDGIQHQYLHYADTALEELRRDIGLNMSVSFVVDSNDLSRIFVQNPRDLSYLAVPCTRPDYANGLTLYQHRYLLRAREEKTQPSVDLLMRTKGIIAEKLRDEACRRETALKKDLRNALINSNAVLHGECRSVTTPFPLCSNGPDGAGPIITPATARAIPPVSNVIHYEVDFG